jgi:hypothetical protein
VTHRELQQRLAALGYPLRLDGVYGPVTRAALLAALTDPPDRPIAAADIERLARGWEVEPAVIWAVREVEASGAAFIGGRPTILYEPHRFSRATGRAFDDAFPSLSYPTWGARPYPATQAARYEQLLDAVALDVAAAFASASWGAFQILGENWRLCGARDPLDFALAEASGEAAQLDHFARFCFGNALVGKLRRHDWAAFARGYNGSAYRANRYDERLAAAYARHAAR